MSERERQILSMLVQMDKQFGKGSVQMLGSEAAQPIPVIPTGSIAVDHALGVGGLPARARYRDFRAGILGQRLLWRSTSLRKPKRWAAPRHSSMPNTRSIPITPAT